MRLILILFFGAMHSGMLLAPIQGRAQPALIDSARVSRMITDSLLAGHVRALSHDSMAGRLTGSPQLLQAAEYIAGEMRLAGLKPLAGSDGFIHPFEMEELPDNPYVFNVVGALRGRVSPDTVIIFSAHYDHVGTRSAQRAIPFGQTNKLAPGDTVFNGANDNASGVAAMLSLAAYLADSPVNRYTLLFVAFAGEEYGLRGSSRFVENLTDRGRVLRNINLEMLGRPPRKRGPFITEAPGSTSLRPLLNRNLRAMHPRFGKQYFAPDRYTSQELFRRSDNFPFHEAGIEANTIMATDPLDRHYHSVTDHWDTLDYPAMTSMVRAIALALAPLL